MIHKHVARLTLMLALAGLAWGAGPGATPVAVPEQGVELSPAVQAAIKSLSAEDFATRESALLALEVAMGQEMRAIVSVNDPEAQARVLNLLTFEEGLCEWTRDVLKLPADQQKAEFDFGLQPALLPQVAHLYAKDVNLRVEAVRALRKVPGAQVSDLLARAIGDREQKVYLAAMEGVYDRPPTQAVIGALWDRAVAAQMATFRVQPTAASDRVTFLGGQVTALSSGDNDLYLRTQDNALATDVLVHLKPPEVLGKVRALFEEAERAFAAKGADESNLWMYMPTQEAMHNAIRIGGVYGGPELVPVLYRIATGPVAQQMPGVLQKGARYYTSNRTWAMAMLLQLTGETPTDWNLRTITQLQGQWVAASQSDEAATALRLRDWWSKAHDKYGQGPDTRPVPQEDTHPAAAEQGAGNPVPKPQLQIDYR